jgi:hypothetical protein
MRRFFSGLMARRFRGAIAPWTALAAACLLAAAAAPAGAVIAPTRDATVAATAAAGPGFTISPQTPPVLSPIPPNGSPVGVNDPKTPLPAFPRDGLTFLVLSTGNAEAADRPDQLDPFPSVDDGGRPVRVRLQGLDTTVLRIPFNQPGAAAPVPACLTFDFRFLSEEYPSRLESAFNDFFVAELDSSTWNTADVGPEISAPNNFAGGPNGSPVTIKSPAPATLAPSEAAGTPYGAATAPLRAQVFVPVPPVGTPATHVLFLSLVDHGDAAYDSAVFIDNLRLSAPSTASSCPSGLTGLGPAPVITGPAIAATVATLTPTLTGTATGPGDVTARIYPGPLAAGAPAQTLPAARFGNAWSVVAADLAPGQYTAQATQANGQLTGVSAPTTFTVVQPPAGSPGQPGGAANSQQQTPGDKDNDGIPDDQDTSDGSLPPVPGKTFDARVVSGDVFIKYPPGAGPRAAAKPPKGFVPLKGAANIPIGAQLDTRSGRVAVTSAADTGGARSQTADFYDGIFQVKQATPKTKPKKPAALITDLVLKGEVPRSQCAPLKGARAAAAKAKKKGPKGVLGSLWGNGKGKFRTNGKYSSATVRGTIWLTQDRCDGTLTTVRRGTVSVRDFKRRRTVSVKAGHSYLARAARGAAKAKGRAK